MCEKTRPPCCLCKLRVEMNFHTGFIPTSCVFPYIAESGNLKAILFVHLSPTLQGF